MIEPTRKRIRRTKQPGDTRRSPRTYDEVSASDKKTNIGEKQAVRVIDSPDFLVGAVPDLCNTQLSEHDISSLASARLLADENEDKEQGAVVVILFGETQADLGQYGVDRVIRFPMDSYAPDKKAHILNKLMDAQPLSHLVFPDSLAGGADLGRRVAAHRGIRAATAIVKLTKNNTTRRAYAGRCEITQALTEILLVSDTISVVIEQAHMASEIDLQLSDITGCISDHGLLPFDPDEISLTESEVVMSAGDGVQDWEGFHKLVKLLNVSEGGSRIIIDKGILERDKQIGASGNIITARCYIALGISGAPQHLQGISDCETVLSVNIDPHCDMVKRANLAIVGDVQMIIPELITLLENEHNGKVG